ncbi:hypothetical protein HYS50_02055 [Candidatus Woesearchaeota archaeon]|nr:hypothetical protein [Candidatus Woesearchaeota archaeon]
MGITFLIFRNKSDKNNIKLEELFKKSWHFGIILILTSIYYKNGIFFLSYFTTETIVGYYSAAFNFLLLFILLPSLANTAVYPLLLKKEESEKDKREFIRKYRILFLFFSVVGISLASLMGEKIIVLLFGSEFAIAGKMFLILSLSTVALFQNYVFGLLLTLLNNQKIVTFGTLIVTVTNILGNAILIKINPLYGAALAFLIAEASGYLFYKIYTKKMNLTTF